jgi:8-amino-7-oxononanoate synthase
MPTLDEELNNTLSERKRLDSFRSLRTPDSKLVDFSSNDYLGLSRSKELQQRIHERTSVLGLPGGATGSRLLTGNNLLTEETEQYLASLFRAESCLIFNSGYNANVGVLSSIPRKGDTILYDEKSHASIKDGVRLSLATRHPFKHNDLSDLESKLKKSAGRVYVVVESIYSMDGDECPIEALVSLKHHYNFDIIIDEAHSTGVMGEYGEGLSVSRGVHQQIAIRIYTFGKGLGTHGACVAGSNVVKDYLVNFSRPLIYSTALSPHTILSIREGFAYINEHRHLLTALRNNIRLYNSLLKERSDSTSAIQTILLPGNSNCRKASAILFEAGFDVRPILSPTVPEGSERLRVCLHAFNTEEEIEQLAEEIVVLKTQFST